jgi:hydrogenase maturation protease
MSVIGIGSPRGDDRVGWCVADALARQPRAADARILKLDRPGAALLDALAGRRRVVIVDAAATGAAPGTLYRVSLPDLAEIPAAASSHGFGLAQALELGRGLGVLPPELYLYLVGIDPRRTVGIGQALSPAVAAAVGRLTAAICRRLVADGR